MEKPAELVGPLRSVLYGKSVLRKARVRERVPLGAERIPHLEAPYEPEYASRTWQSYCVRVGAHSPVGRTELMRRLLHDGIATRRGVMASHLEKVYLDRVGKVSLPITEQKARSTMLIPLFATMTDDEQSYVIESLREELRAA